jgi:hypothetical protein
MLPRLWPLAAAASSHYSYRLDADSKIHAKRPGDALSEVWRVEIG